MMNNTTLIQAANFADFAATLDILKEDHTANAIIIIEKENQCIMAVPYNTDDLVKILGMLEYTKSILIETRMGAE